MLLHRVTWVSTFTGQRGAGKWSEDEVGLRAFVDLGNAELPGILHSLESEPMSHIRDADRPAHLRRVQKDEAAC